MRAIASGAEANALRRLGELPALATTPIARGATRTDDQSFFLAGIAQYVYAGATVLHVAAAGYQEALVRKLLAIGADVHARDRRGAEPIHVAAIGMPGSLAWNPRRQAATIATLLEGGADPNAIDKNGVTALHRAVRTRCAAAVQALLDGSADPEWEQPRVDAVAAGCPKYRSGRHGLIGGQRAAKRDPAPASTAGCERGEVNQRAWA